MKFLSVNFDLNQKYHVDKIALEQAIIKSISNILWVKVNHLKTTIDKFGEQIDIIIDVSLDSWDKLEEKILKISTNINFSIKNLVNSKPKNIQIQIKGVSNE